MIIPRRLIGFVRYFRKDFARRNCSLSVCQQIKKNLSRNMVEFTESEREKLKTEVLSTVVELGNSSLQDEHRKTGKALAIGIVVFVVALGLYHAVVYGSSRLSALVGGFIIMLLYLISLLYSWHRKKKLTKSNEAALEREIKEVIVKASKSPLKKPDSEGGRKQASLQERPLLVRTYSVG